MVLDAVLKIDGECARQLSLSYDDLARIAGEHQVPDVSRIVPGRKGDAVRFAGILELVQAGPAAKYLGLHSSKDDFHASVPLAAVADKALVIYRLDGQPLPEKSGGPIRFFIHDFAACHTHEIDECANVKFVDRIELTGEKGFDNRPHDGVTHEELHRRQAP